MIDLFKPKRASSILGLSLDGNRLEAVVLRRSNDSLQLLQKLSVPLALSPLSGDLELVGREIRNHLNEAGIRERRVQRQFVVGDVLLFADDGDEFFLDLGSGHRTAMIPRVRRRYWVLYPVWIALCAILFLSLRHREDPSRRPGRILSDDAAVRAVASLQRSNPVRFQQFEAVHVAWAGRGEGGDSDRWVVLCDRVSHTALRAAMVVELDGKDGRVLVIRRVKSEM